MSRFQSLMIPRGHLPALTGLRGVAAVWVLLYHLWQFAGAVPVWLGPVSLTPIFSCGYFGVDLFFVLSGFLVGEPFVRARLQAAPMPELAEFWRRRLRRVLPAYWCQVAILLAIGLSSGHMHDLSLFGLAGDLLLVFNLRDAGAPLNPVYWSLPVEWDYYIILPLLALGFPSGVGRPWVLLGAIVLAVTFRVACWWAFREWPTNGVAFYQWIVQLPGRIDQFVFGMAAAWLHITGSAKRWWLPLQIAGLAMIFFCVWEVSPRGDIFAKVDVPWLFWHCTLLGAGFAALIASCASMPLGAVLSRVLSTKFLLVAGVVSYSLYLWHFPVISWAAPIIFAYAQSPGLAWWALVLCLCVVAATVSYVAVERPFLQPRGKGWVR